MTVETATYISDLNASYPGAADSLPEGDDHLRLLKSTIKATFPNISGAVTPTHTELNYVDGVTSAIQTQLDAKAPAAGPTFTGTVVLPSTTTIGSVSYAELALVKGAVLLQTVTASTSATVDLETTFDTTYDAYMIVVSGAVADVTLASMYVRMKLGGAYASANYGYHSRAVNGSSSSYNANVSTSTTGILLTGSLVQNSTSVDMVLFTHNPAGSQAKSLYFHGGAAPYVEYGGAGSNTSTSALTGVRFFMSSGNIASGKFRLYGIKNS